MNIVITYIGVSAAFIIGILYFWCVYKGKKKYRGNEMPPIRQGIGIV